MDDTTGPVGANAGVIRKVKKWSFLSVVFFSLSRIVLKLKLDLSN